MTRDSEIPFSSCLPEKYLVKVPRERCEEERECHDEAAHDRRQAGGLPAAEGHDERGQDVGHPEVDAAQPNWKEMRGEKAGFRVTTKLNQLTVKKKYVRLEKVNHFKGDIDGETYIVLNIKSIFLAYFYRVDSHIEATTNTSTTVTITIPT